jgi:hypothetical protein
VVRSLTRMPDAFNRPRGIRSTGAAARHIHRARLPLLRGGERHRRVTIPWPSPLHWRWPIPLGGLPGLSTPYAPVR